MGILFYVHLYIVMFWYTNLGPLKVQTQTPFIYCYIICIYLPFQVTLLLSKISSEIVGEPLDPKRLYDAVNVILSLQVCWIKAYIWQFYKIFDTLIFPHLYFLPSCTISNVLKLYISQSHNLFSCTTIQLVVKMYNWV